METITLRTFRPIPYSEIVESEFVGWERRGRDSGKKEREDFICLNCPDLYGGPEDKCRQRSRRCPLNIYKALEKKIEREEVKQYAALDRRLKHTRERFRSDY